MKKILLVFLQCTWGLLQTLLGAIVFLILIRSKHEIYRASIRTGWKIPGGMSLGLFIFTPDDDTAITRSIIVHEYGHCVQSALLGPFYLILAVISLLWARLPCFIRLRKEKGVRYTSCFVESWASRWGELFTKEKATWF